MILELKKEEIVSLIILSIFSGTLGLILLLFINQSILSININYKYLFSFLSVLIYAFVFHKIFQEQIINISNDYILKKELQIIKIIGNSSLENFERINKGRVLGVVEDIRGLVFIPYLISNGLTSIFLFLGGIIYLFFLSSKAAVIFFLFVFIFVALYQIINRINVKLTSTARVNNQNYFVYLTDLIDGFKEIILSKNKKHTLLDEVLLENRVYAKDLEIRVSNVFLLGNLLGSYSLWSLLGIIAFLFPVFGILETQKVVSFIFILLFLSGPVSTIMSLQNFAIKISVALKRINTFTEELKNLRIDKNNTSKSENLKEFKNIKFVNTTFKYRSSSFNIHPIDLKIEKGETVFVIGGNGSGKSTFIKLLLSLYSPTSGKILINNQPVSLFKQGYRELFSPIFTNNHLFSEHYENYNVEISEEYNKLLKKMKLDSIINKNEDVSKRTFSKGQGKRLSMIYALLEKRPVLVLDEWAADQDPHFRKYFYEELIPELKRQGKTIIAVTHDDAYFKHADRIIKFEYGKIVKDLYTKDRNALNELNIW